VTPVPHPTASLDGPVSMAQLQWPSITSMAHRARKPRWPGRAFTARKPAACPCR
jgi:hypothetical protein